MAVLRGPTPADIGVDTFDYNNGCPSSLPAWASIIPASGVVSAGSSQAADVVFDSTGLAAGVYTGTLCLTSNSIVNPFRVVPLTLTVTVPVGYGVIQTPASAAQNGNPGAVVTYTLTVTNTGNTSDSYAISITGATWSTVATPTTVGPLAAGASTTVQVQVTVPANAVASASDVATVTATSLGDASQTASSALTTTANQVYGVIQTPASSAQNGNPGAVVTYTFTLTNTGNSSDSYAISITGATWSTVANPTTVGPVAAGASATVQVQVTVPSNAVDGTSDTATVTATSQGDNTQSG